MAARAQESAVGVGGAALVIVLGGAAALVGSLLTWIQIGRTGILARLGGGTGIGVHGTTLLSGKVALTAGIALIVCGPGLWIARGGNARRWLAVAAVVAAALIVGATIAAFQNEVAALLRGAVGGLGRLAGRGRGAGLAGRVPRFLGLSRGPGLYLALTGGIVALAGSIAGVFWTTAPVSVPPARSVEEDPSAPTQPFSKGRAA
jgi:hypothetical protein